MLYRSWAHMYDIAGYPLTTGWIYPTEAQIKNLSGSARARASVHRSRDKSGLDTNPGGEARRAKVRTGFAGPISAASSRAAAERSSRPPLEK